MHLLEHTINDVHVLRPQGRIDASCISDFAACIQHQIDKGTRKILLDFSEIEYLSSSSIYTLIEAYRSLEERGGIFALCSLHDSVLEIFRTVNLDQALLIYPSEFEAVNDLQDRIGAPLSPVSRKTKNNPETYL